MFFCCPKSFLYVLKQFIVTIQLQTAICWASTGTVVICAKNKQTKKHKTNKTKLNTIPHFQNQKWGKKANLIHVEIV